VGQRVVREVSDIIHAAGKFTVGAADSDDLGGPFMNQYLDVILTWKYRSDDHDDDLMDDMRDKLRDWQRAFPGKPVHLIVDFGRGEVAGEFATSSQMLKFVRELDTDTFKHLTIFGVRNAYWCASHSPVDPAKAEQRCKAFVGDMDARDLQAYRGRLKAYLRTLKARYGTRDLWPRCRVFE
jgi:hypothetical protein